MKCKSIDPMKARLFCSLLSALAWLSALAKSGSVDYSQGADGLADATAFVRAIEERQGLQMSCIEEIAWHQGWIDDAQLHALADGYGKSTYGQYLRRLADGRV